MSDGVIGFDPTHSVLVPGRVTVASGWQMAHATIGGTAETGRPLSSGLKILVASVGRAGGSKL